MPHDAHQALLGLLADVRQGLRRIAEALEGRDESMLAGGRATAPAAGAEVVRLNLPPPGRYEIQVHAAVSNATDTGNIELREGPNKIILPGLGTTGPDVLTILRRLDGETSLSLNATCAGGGAVVYSCALVATRVE